MSHTINVTDLADQNAVHRILMDIQHHGTSYALVQGEVEVAKVVPAEVKNDYNDKISAELAEKRLRIMDEVEEFSKRIAHLWSTDETSAEAVANNRR